MKPKIGTQYFIFWQTGLAGPFTYEGGDDYMFRDFIVGDVGKLLLAKEGINYMFKHGWQLDEKRDFAGQIPEIFAVERIDAELAKTNDEHVKMMLTVLKECVPLINAASGG